MPRPAVSSFRLPAAVVLVLGAVYLLASGTQPGKSAQTTAAAAPGGARSAPVTAVTRSCPPPAPGTGHASVAMVAAAPEAAASTAKAAPASGQATLTAVPYAAANGATGNGSGTAKASGTGKANGTANGNGTSTAPITAPNAATVLSAPQPSADGATQLSATGSLAAGFEAEQSNSFGMGTVACTHAGSDAWFVGTGQGAGASSIWLYLTNQGDIPTSVELTTLTDAGPQSSPDDDLTVAPHSYTSVNLASVASGSQVLAVHVQTTSGQVAANVWESGSWLPAAQAPATRLVIPGLTASGGAARLLVAVPGSKDARVTVTALTTQGQSQPLGRAPVDATAASASGFALSSLGASASALVLTSTVPIVAGAEVPGSGTGEFTAATAPVTEQGVVAGNPSGGGNSVALVLSAPSAGARVAISVIPGKSNVAERPARSPALTRSLLAGRTSQVTVSPPKGVSGPFAVAVTPLPGSGPVYAARAVLSGSGTLLSLLPVPSAETSVQLPPAVDSYTALTGS